MPNTRQIFVAAPLATLGDVQSLASSIMGVAITLSVACTDVLAGEPGDPSIATHYAGNWPIDPAIHQADLEVQLGPLARYHVYENPDEDRDGRRRELLATNSPNAAAILGTIWGPTAAYNDAGIRPVPTSGP